MDFYGAVLEKRRAHAVKGILGSFASETRKSRTGLKVMFEGNESTGLVCV